jgi:hypothetical protein
MPTNWNIEVTDAIFVANGDKLEIQMADGVDVSKIFLSMQKQLQSAMMKTVRSANPVRTVPAPLPPSPRTEKMPATPIAGPGAGAPTPQHKTMPIRPPMSPSAIRPRGRLAPSPSYGRLMHEQTLAQERRNREAGVAPPSNKHVIPNSYERLTSEIASRHSHMPHPVDVEVEAHEEEHVNPNPFADQDHTRPNP